IKGTVWEDAAERASQQLAKGAKVFVTGDLDTQEWEQDGQKRSAPALTIRRFEVIPRSDATPPPQSRPSPQGEHWNGQQAPQQNGRWQIGEQAESGNQTAPQQQGFVEPPF